MAVSTYVALLSALVAGSAAQSSTGQTVWASFAYIMHGERTPLMGSVRDIRMLTPAGAQQMYAQGNAFRSRYVRAPSTELEKNETTITTREHIRNLYMTVDDYTQIDIITTDDPWVSTSAIAFMQALYPPTADETKHPKGGSDMAKDAATGKFTQYPLGGYEYPFIKTYGTLEEGSVPLAGTAMCSNWRKSAVNDLIKDKWGDNKNGGQGTTGFYREIFAEQAFNGTSTEPLDPNELNIYNSYVIHDFVRYMFEHNKTVHDNLKSTGNTTDTNDYLKVLKDYADEFTFEQNANTKVGIRPIAGKALAQKVLDQFHASMGTLGKSPKLTLAFGSYEPIRAFAALAGLTGNTWDDTSTEAWKEIPQHGAALVFELIGKTPGSSAFPKKEDLKVRLYYRRNTDQLSGFRRYPLFSTEVTTEPGVKWADFESKMNEFAISPYEWCKTCNSQAPFCQAFQSGSVFNPKSKSAVISGVIGAAIMVAIFGIAIASLVVCFGMRVHRKGKGGPLGGFKGAEKMASDADLTVSDRGAHHERVGSWELRDGGDPPSGGAGLVKTGVTANMRRMDDDAILEMGLKPVQPRESV